MIRLRYRFIHRAGRRYYWTVTPAHAPERTGYALVAEFWRAS